MDDSVRPFTNAHGGYQPVDDDDDEDDDEVRILDTHTHVLSGLKLALTRLVLWILHNR
jgi:hypothetical protein